MDLDFLATTTEIYGTRLLFGIKMNKRIHELFDRTLAQFNEEHKDAPYRAMFIVPDPVKEKFAELIVRECSQYIEDKFDFCGDELIIAEKLLEHFGVEK